MTKCQQFKSKDEEVELIPVDEFYNNAPKEISKEVRIWGIVTGGDEV